MKVDTNAQTIDEILGRGVVSDITPSKKEFVKKLTSGDRLRLYLGIDVTAPAIHLGHAGNLLLLEDFRKLGHEIVVLLGDFTARIGDPTGKEKSRQEVSEDEVSKNISLLTEQIKMVIDTNGDNPATIRKNSEWLSELTFQEILDLARNFTVQQLLERDMFKKRISQKQPIFLHEFLYPILQGYDSVALETDVEVGGTDQLFNMMTGRLLLERMKGKEKFVITTNLLQNPNTGILMSKSAGTGIFLDGTSDKMFGELMAQEDDMIVPLLIHCSRAPVTKVETLSSTIKKGGQTARDAKLESAEIIVESFFPKEESERSRTTFISTFSKGDLSDIQVVKLPYKKEKLFIALVDAGLAESNTDSKRLIEEGAVEINGSKVKDPFEEILVENLTVRVGKHRFARLTS